MTAVARISSETAIASDHLRSQTSTIGETHRDQVWPQEPTVGFSPGAEPDYFEELPSSTLESTFKRGTSLVETGARQDKSELLAEWHGQVTSIEGGAFRADLSGTHGRGVIGMQEEALIPLEDVSVDDLDLLVEGAFFRLCISYETDVRRVRRRCTTVVFRRMPAYRRDELEEARRAGLEIARALRLE